ncbi:MAG TPA: hypothetical protein VF729_05355 [Solirubrobacterales bacterium]
MRSSFEVNSKEHPEKGVPVVDGALRNLEVIAPAGFTGNPTAVPHCETLDFLTEDQGHPSCADSAAVGVLTVKVRGGKGIIGEETVPIYNLRPSPGVAGKLGFWVANVPNTLDVNASPKYPYNIVASLSNASQAVEVLSAVTTLWGNPADPLHDPDRGLCAYDIIAGTCPADIPVRPFITLPRSCTGPLITTFKAESWWSGEPLDPGPPAFFQESTESPGMIGCSGLGFGPAVAATPTTDHAESPSGLDFDIDVDDEGLGDPEGRADSDIQKTVVTFPEGVTANPSLAEGLAACSPQDLARETVTSLPGEGCPQASKIGTIEAETPILEGKILKGALFIATQDDPSTPQPGAENPFDTLIAQYIVIKDQELGVIVKQAGKLEPDSRTGQLRATFDDLPPVPLSHVRLRLREGGRSPLITPPACGTYNTEALLTPSGNPSTSFPAPSSFPITRGVGGGPCPPAGTPPFAPGFTAGTVNNHAGAYSPFYMRLTRRDGDQDLTRFDATLPPGVVAKLAGVSRCSDAEIALAKTKRGREELASPSCPANSLIGHVQGGTGVGSQLTYVPGKLYLAGPLAGAPLSVVAIVPAVAGPFDVGTVVVRQALQIDPTSAEVRADGAHSDPLPHILAGIPLRVRDIRVHVDRPDFTLNPTNCDRFATLADIWGGGINVFSIADDAPVSRAERFRAANCARLDFKPRLSLTLKGGTKRGAHPALKGVYRPRPGDANASGLVTRLPRSAFLDQGHIRTICTRVQFAADACPPGAIYGQVTAFTPLLEEPLRGPAYLRSSNNKLPDLVLDLRGLVDVEVSARIDSIKGGIRATFGKVPDAPISKVLVDFAGAKKGLIVNSRDLCAGPSRATVTLNAQNGKRRKLRPAVRATGCRQKRGGRKAQ